MINNNNSKQNFITSNNFARLSDVVFTEVISKQEYSFLQKDKIQILSEDANQIKYITKEFQLKENDLIFCSTDFVLFLFQFLRNTKNLHNLKLITHWSDTPINKDLYLQKPDCISEWYSPHVNFDAKDLISIPLGLSGDYSPKNLLIRNFQSAKKIQSKNKKYLLYVNFQKNTNLDIRSQVFRTFSKLSWVKYDEPNLSLDEYLNRLQNSKFVLCPFGNGYDTHRVWEALYAGSYPVVINHKSFECTDTLPVLKVDSFDEITEELLEETYENYKKMNFDENALSSKFWVESMKRTNYKNKKTIHISISNYRILFLKFKFFTKQKIKRYKKIYIFRARQLIKLFSLR